MIAGFSGPQHNRPSITPQHRAVVSPSAEHCELMVGVAPLVAAVVASAARGPLLPRTILTVEPSPAETIAAEAQPPGAEPEPVPAPAAEPAAAADVAKPKKRKKKISFF